MTRNNTRLHPDAVGVIGAFGSTSDNGATSVAVPSGASGIIMQSHYHQSVANTKVFWIPNTEDLPMTGEDQGFALPGADSVLKFWFDPSQITYFNFWLQDSATLMYRFIHPARPI